MEYPETHVLLKDIPSNSTCGGLILKKVGNWLDTGYVYKTRDGLVVIASMDQTERHGELLHVSLSRGDRLPSWNEVLEIKGLFFGPKVDAMMLLPKAQDYVSLHQFCFHIWQCPVTWGIR